MLHVVLRRRFLDVADNIEDNPQFVHYFFLNRILPVRLTI